MRVSYLINCGKGKGLGGKAESGVVSRSQETAAAIWKLTSTCRMVKFIKPAALLLAAVVASHTSATLTRMGML